MHRRIPALLLLGVLLLPGLTAETSSAPQDCVPVDTHELAPYRYDQDVQRRWNAWSRDTTGVCTTDGPGTDCVFQDALPDAGATVCWWGFDPPDRPEGCVPSEPTSEEGMDWARRLLPYTRGVCLLHDGEQAWKCYGVIREEPGTHCWWPAKLDLADRSITLAFDVDDVQLLAADTLWLGETQTLVGEGTRTIDLVLGEARVRVAVVDLRITDVRFVTPPAGCSPADPAQAGRAQADPEAQSRWASWSADSDVCQLGRAPRPNECRHADFVEAFQADSRFLTVPGDLFCWWGTSSSIAADFTIRMAIDTFLALSNAPQRDELVRHLLKQDYVVLSADDPLKQAGIRTLLDSRLGPAHAPTAANNSDQVYNPFGVPLGYANPASEAAPEGCGSCGVLTVRPDALALVAGLSPDLIDVAGAFQRLRGMGPDGPVEETGVAKTQQGLAYVLGQRASIASGEFLLRQGVAVEQPGVAP